LIFYFNIKNELLKREGLWKKETFNIRRL